MTTTRKTLETPMKRYMVHGWTRNAFALNLGRSCGHDGPCLQTALTVMFSGVTGSNEFQYKVLFFSLNGCKLDEMVIFVSVGEKSRA